MNKKLIIFILIIVNIILLGINDEIYDINNYKTANKKINNNLLDIELIKAGINEAKNNEILICGLVRNCEKQMINNIKPLENFCSYFKKYKVVIFENDSNDNTREILKSWEQNNNNIHLIKCKNNYDCKLKTKTGYNYGQFNKKRFLKMAYYRDHYMKHVKRSNSKYTMLIDFDLDLNFINIPGFMYTLSTHDKWNGIFINGKNSLPLSFSLLNFPYDALAYSHNNKFIRIKNNTNKYNFNNLFLTTKLYLSLIKKSNQDNIITPVESAFNGMCVYKTNELKKYTYLKNFDGTYCEHIHINKQMNNLYIANKWISIQKRQGDGNIIKQINNVLKF